MLIKTTYSKVIKKEKQTEKPGKVKGGKKGSFVDDPTHLVHDGTENQARRNNIITTMTCAPNITQVADGAYLRAKNLISIDLPEGITIIGIQSFSECYSLKEIKFPKSLTKIDYMSFAYCSSIEEVDLLQTKAQELGPSAFYNCTSLRSRTRFKSLMTIMAVSSKTALS